MYRMAGHKEYAKLLPKVREMYGLSQDKFAGFLGVDSDQYKKYESGQEETPEFVLMIFGIDWVTATVRERLKDDPDWIAYKQQCKDEMREALRQMYVGIDQEREATSKTARNKRIIEMSKAGSSLTEIANVTKLTPQRVHQILKEQSDEDNNQ